MSDNRTRRIMKELRDIDSDSDCNVICNFVGEDVSHLEAQFQGPPDTAYEGGTFVVDIKIPNEYPFRPPIMKFKTLLWHPNVSSVTGAICLDTIGSAWSPVLTVKSAILSLQSLLSSPEPKDPQDHVVADMLMKDPAKFHRTAREWAVMYAGAPRGNPESSSSIQQTPAPSELSRQLTEAELRAKYEGYNKDLIDRFVGMGFDVETVVAAFNFVGIDKMGGLDYELEEAYMGDITARLLGEP